MLRDLVLERRQPLLEIRVRGLLEGSRPARESAEPSAAAVDAAAVFCGAREAATAAASPRTPSARKSNARFTCDLRGSGGAPDFLEAALAAAVLVVSRIAERVHLAVVLVVLLRGIELRQRNDLGDDLSFEARLLFELRLRGERRGLLRLAGVEDRRAVLRSVIAELAVLLRRVDVVPVDLEKLLVRDLCRIERDLRRFGVAGAARRNLLVGRVDRRAAGVAGDGRDDTGQILEGALLAPEAASGEHGDLVGGRKGRHRDAGGEQNERDSQKHSGIQGMDLLTPKPLRCGFDSGARWMVPHEVRRRPLRGFRGGKPRPVKEFARKKGWPCG